LSCIPLLRGLNRSWRGIRTLKSKVPLPAMSCSTTFTYSPPPPCGQNNDGDDVDDDLECGKYMPKDSTSGVDVILNDRDHSKGAFSTSAMNISCEWDSSCNLSSYSSIR
jgi:hypothetical protein